MNSLVLPTQTNEHDQSAIADDGHKKQTLREHRVKYVYVPVLKELILVSVALRSDKLSQCFYSCLDGMLSLRKVTPSPPPPNIKFAATHLYTWVERGTVREQCFGQEHNATQWPHVADDLQELSSKGFITINIFSRRSTD